MGIQIISISHKVAPLHVREMFAFTKEQQEDMMRRMTEYLEVSFFPPAIGRKCTFMRRRTGRA